MSETQSGQSYANHKRFHPAFHYVVLSMLSGVVVLSGEHLIEALLHSNGRMVAFILFCLAFATTLGFFYTRGFALRAQDRAIRAEENFRHFILTGKPLDASLRMGQIIALRFASDEEFPALAIKAASGNMKVDEIKQAIKNWRGDYHRA
jgi:hypothetical protein